MKSKGNVENIMAAVKAVQKQTGPSSVLTNWGHVELAPPETMPMEEVPTGQVGANTTLAPLAFSGVSTTDTARSCCHCALIWAALGVVKALTWTPTPTSITAPHALQIRPPQQAVSHTDGRGSIYKFKVHEGVTVNMYFTKQGEGFCGGVFQPQLHTISVPAQLHNCITRNR